MAEPLGRPCRHARIGAVTVGARPRRRGVAGRPADPRRRRGRRPAAGGAATGSLFVTNNSVLAGRRRRGEAGRHRHPGRRRRPHLGDGGRPAGAPGERVLLCGGPGVGRGARARRGAERASTDGDGRRGRGRLPPQLRLRASCAGRRTAVRRGARLIGTNDDATYPTPTGPIPGGGAILAAVVAGSGTAPVVAGKPYEPMADLVAGRAGRRPRRRRHGRATGPTPTAASPGPSAAASGWCSRG